MNNLLHLACNGSLAFVLGLSAPSTFAARSFTPQAGTWIINDEATGNPGRGIALDVQGNTLFMQVFAYDEVGDSVFYAASGNLEKSSTTVKLIQYKDGRYFGGEKRDATELAAVGDVELNFDSGLSGTIKFPGESEKKFQRLLTNDSDVDISKYFSYLDEPFVETARVTQGRYSLLYTLDKDGKPTSAWKASVFRWWPHANISYGDDIQKPRGSDDIELEILGAFESDRSKIIRQIMGCRIEKDESLNCTSRNTFDKVQHVKLYRAGAAYIGEATFTNASDNSYYMQAIKGSVKSSETLLAGNNDQPRKLRQEYSSIFSSVACPGFCPLTITNQVPPSGTWIIADELTGKPGRGISLDIQDRVAVAQIFNYQASGKASFYMGTSMNYPDLALSFDLKRYAGGRYFGGKPQDAIEVEDAGVATFSKIKTDNAYSYKIMFPKEKETSIQRLAMESSSWQFHMMGTWAFQWSENDPPMIEILSVIGDQFISSEDGKVKCSLRNELIYCVNNSYGNATKVLSPISPADLPFGSNNNSIRIKDNYGNLLGI